MGLRIQAYILGSVLLLMSTLASALGLGELKLNSALNQPLNAEIELRNVRGLTEREIRVGMAPHEAFRNAGVERAYFLSDFRFQVDLQAPGGPVIRVTSENPVREPFLNFIVQAEWPSGRLLREYTALVDLPAFSGAPAEPTRAAPREPTRARPEPSPRRPAAQPSERRPAPPRAGGEYGPVSANENLWSIASRARPDSSVSVQQTMLAIQRLNPNAFINDNINLLRRGQVLRLPDLSEIQQLSQREAVNEVADQNRRWTERSDTARAPQIEGRRDVRPAPAAPDAVEGRVRLSSQEERDESGVAAGRDGEQRAIANQLNVAQEQLDAARRENTELSSRIRAMEEQMETMERLLEVSSDEMRALELAIRQSEEARRTDEEAVAPAEPVDEQPVVTEDPAPEAVEDRPAAAEPVRPEPVVVRSERTLMDRLFDNLLYVAIGLGALVIAVAAVIFMRRRNDGFDDEFEDFDDDYSMEEEYSESDDLVEDDDTVIMAGAASSDDDQEVAAEEHRFAEAETEDVVAECDIHIAYGQYGQAEEKLLRALEHEPTNSAMRVKLLEVYAAQGDGESFDQQYARLRSLGDRSAIDRAEVLRSTIPGIGSFDASQFESEPLGESGFAQDDSSQSDDLDLGNDSGLGDDTLQFDLGEAEATSAQEREFDTPEVTEPDDLDLALDDLDIDDQAAEKPRSAGEDDLEELDLELADDDFDVDFDELDLALDEPSSDSKPSAEEPFGADDLTLEPMESEDDTISERTAVLEEPELDFDLDDETDLEQDDSSDDLGKLTSEFSENVVAEKRTSSTDDLQDLDFDFDDLELGQEASDSDEDTLDSLNDGDLDFDDKHVDFDLVDRSDDSDASKPGQATGFEGLEDESLEGENTLENWDDLDEASESPTSDQLASDESKRSGPENSELDEELSSLDDFDADVDLDGEFDLDQLDQELDSLSGGLDELEEPVTPAPSAEEPPKVAEEAGSGADAQQDFEIPDFDPEEDDDSNLGFLSDSDETATKLDLARAYIDMGDADGARDILDEIAEEGNDEQKKQAKDLLSRLN